jgi:Lon protease-like protein
MTNFIAVFPLSLVLYPGEHLNLHIFEPRFKQMIADCINEKKSFGILPVVNGQVMELGTLTEITSVEKIYEDGRMDIRTKGIKVFRVLELIKNLPDKLYSGAIVTYTAEEQINISKNLAQLIIDEVRRLYKLLNEEAKLPRQFDDWNSYMFAQKCGLNLQQSYELLSLLNEMHRLEYLRRYLQDRKPVLDELERLKARIKMNGQFRNLNAHDL